MAARATDLLLHRILEIEKGMCRQLDLANEKMAEAQAHWDYADKLQNEAWKLRLQLSPES